MIVLYTSGSTGKPKGVMLVHRGLVNFTAFIHHDLELAVQDRIVQFGSPAFDASVFETAMALTTGAGLYVLPKERVYDYRGYEDFLNKHSISALLLPPIYFNNLLPERVNPVRIMISGGARAVYGLIDKWKHQTRYINGYGPTEITIACTMFNYIDGAERYATVPVGKPIINTRIYILDTHGHPCPIDVAGEVYIAGDGLARGYLNRPELTAEKFVYLKREACRISQITQIKGDDSNPVKLYKCGDLARWLPDGNIEFLGRVDQMVKIRGQRTEPGEIENKLMEFPGVKEAVVMAKENENGDAYLCAYLFSDEGMEFKPSELREHLDRFLPDYMIPSYYMSLKTEEMPMTPSDKVDRNALPEMEAVSEYAYVAPRNETERKLADIWSEALNVNAEKIGVDDNYFDLGGNSTNIIGISGKIRETFNYDISVVDLFRYTSISSLSKHLETDEKEMVEETRLEEMKDAVQEAVGLFGGDEDELDDASVMDDVDVYYNSDDWEVPQQETLTDKTKTETNEGEDTDTQPADVWAAAVQQVQPPEAEYEVTEQLKPTDRVTTQETGDRRIAIIGLSGRFPGARNPEELWQNLVNGVESVSFYTEEELLNAGVSGTDFNSGDYVKTEGALLEAADCFDASFFGFVPTEAELMDPQGRLFYECVWEALENAGYTPGRFNGRIGLFGGGHTPCGMGSRNGTFRQNRHFRQFQCHSPHQ